jgi:hypothetical protein
MREHPQGLLNKQFFDVLSSSLFHSLLSLCFHRDAFHQKSNERASNLAPCASDRYILHHACPSLLLLLRVVFDGLEYSTWGTAKQDENNTILPPRLDFIGDFQ